MYKRQADHIFDYIEIDEQHAIFEVQVPEAWIGKSIGELDVRRKFGINILGIKHAGKTDRIHRGYRPKEKGSNSRFILILIALVFLSPFIITAASGVFSILLVVILFPFLAIFVSGVVAFAFIVAACACISVGVGILVTNTAVGLLVMGIGCLLFASGILFCILTGWLGSTIFPWILRKVTDFFQKIVYRNKKEEQA